MSKPIPYKGKDPYIFISYAHRDSARVWPIIEQMQRDGYRVWYDEGIDPGTDWDDFIADKILSCSRFLALITKNYVLSEDCIDELRFARELGKEKLLIYLEEAELPSGLKMRLGNQQAILWYHYPDTASAFAKLYDVEDFQRAKLSPTAHMTADELYDRAEQLRSIATPESVMQAYEHMRLAAELGHPKAMTTMGVNCQYGHYTAKSIKKAIHWYRSAAQEGEPDAQYYLAELYFSGQDVPRDVEEALHWYHLAANQGHPEAQLKLGDIYYCGQDAVQDIPTALAWYRKAANSGSGWAPDAQHMLGKRYEELGDLDAARHWYSVAAKNSHFYSLLCLQQLDNR